MKYFLLCVAAMATCAQFMSYGFSIKVALNSEDFMLLETDYTISETTQDGSTDILSTPLTPSAIAQNNSIFIDNLLSFPFLATAQGISLTGHVTFPSGLVPNDVIVLGMDMNTGHDVAHSKLNSTGHYSFIMAPSTPTYIAVSFRYNNHSCYNSEIVTSSILTSDKVLNLEVSVVMWSGTVVNVDGMPLGSVTISGNSLGEDKYGHTVVNSFKDIVTDAAGRFSVYAMNLNAYSMIFTPPIDLGFEKHYMTKTVNSLTISSTEHQIVVLTTGVLLSGIVIFPSGLVRDDATVSGIDRLTGLEVAQSGVDIFDHYNLVIEPSISTYIQVSFNYNSYASTGSNTIACLTMTSDKVLNLVIPGVMSNGVVVSDDEFNWDE